MIRGLCWALVLLGRFCAASAAQPLPRKILALYSRKEISAASKDIAETSLHKFAEMPLNHLGMELVFQNIADPLPNIGDLADYRGVITWFSDEDSVPNPERYCRWLEDVSRAGLKIVWLGSLGVFSSAGEEPRLSAGCKPVLERLGLTWESFLADTPLFLDVTAKDSNMVEFERKFLPRDIHGLPMVRASPGARSYLKIGTLESPPRTTEPIVTTAWGGVALDPFVLYANMAVEPHQYRWRLNPFAFFEEAFAIKGWPRPDATTANGRRLYFSQIDGDGFFNISELDRKSWSGEIFLREILEKHPDSPFTASLITGYYDLRAYGGPQALSLSRRVLNLPNVEPASHGYAHPLAWQDGKLALDIPGYRLDARKEILGSIAMINRQLLAGRKAELFLWTGDCRPGVTQIGIPAENGLLNLNGGVGKVDSRYDQRFPSYAFLAPLSRRIGRARQVYAPVSNEDSYTNLWTGPYYGYREVIETFERTESPRRVKPIDVYVHYYSAEKIAGLATLKKVYAWVFSQPLFPIRAGEYARIVGSSFDMELSRLGDGHFLLRGGAFLRTVRFDGERRVPDLKRSRGVIGFKRFQGNLYVFLSEQEPREIVLASRPNEGVPYLVEANFEVMGWQAQPGVLRFKKRGWWAGAMVLGGLKPGKDYRIVSGKLRLAVRSREDGCLEVSFPDSERGGPPSEVLVELAS